VSAVLAGCQKSPPPSPPSDIGGPFHLIDQHGVARDAGLLKGKWSAVFFGYTFCPDTCPATMTALARAHDLLGPDAARFQVVFITVDPDRDTPAQMASWLSSASFPKGAIGLTGSPAQIAAAARAWKVWYRKAGSGPNYSMDHTSIVYLMDPDGRFSRPLPMTAPADIARQIQAAEHGA
jgi:protein SCO1/2